VSDRVVVSLMHECVCDGVIFWSMVTSVDQTWMKDSCEVSAVTMSVVYVGFMVCGVITFCLITSMKSPDVWLIDCFWHWDINFVRSSNLIVDEISTWHVVWAQAFHSVVVGCDEVSVSCQKQLPVASFGLFVHDVCSVAVWLTEFFMSVVSLASVETNVVVDESDSGVAVLFQSVVGVGNRLPDVYTESRGTTVSSYVLLWMVSTIVVVAVADATLLLGVVEERSGASDLLHESESETERCPVFYDRVGGAGGVDDAGLREACVVVHLGIDDCVWVCRVTRATPCYSRYLDGFYGSRLAILHVAFLEFLSCADLFKDFGKDLFQDVDRRNCL
jgi:hypothetical protein